MIRYKAEDGLVSVIADDILAIQDAVYQNITDRLGIIVKRYGVKGDAEHSFSLSYSYVGLNVFEVRCSDVGPVVFGDYIYVANTETEAILSASATFSAGETKYIYLKRIFTYSNDQEDNFRPGHPVDENGDPPPSGYDIESEHILELGLSTSDDMPVYPVVILGTITRIELTEEATILDSRRSNSLSLNDFGLIRPNEAEIEDLQIVPLFQNSIIKIRSINSNSVNKTPSQANMTANRIYLETSWLPDDDAFGYQLQLQILDFQDRPILKSITEIVPHIDGVDRITTYVEAVAGLKYRVSVRSLASNPNHDPGPWTIEDVYAGVPDLTLSNAIPTPELSVISVHGDGETSTVRHMVKISAMPAESTPEPYFVQIFRLSAPLTGSNVIASDAILLYEGNTLSYFYNIPPGITCYFAARTVAPGNICSPMVYVENNFSASQLVEDIPQEFVINIPIAFHWVKATDSNPFKILKFNTPAPYCRLKKMYFYPHGSALITSGDTTIGIELVVDQEGTFPFLDGTTNGKTANTNRKLEWGPDDFLTSVALGLSYTPDEYYQGYNLQSVPPTNRGISWNSNDEITVWLAAYDLVAGTSSIVLAGNLILVFEKITEVEDG